MTREPKKPMTAWNVNLEKPAKLPGQKKKS